MLKDAIRTGWFMRRAAVVPRVCCVVCRDNRFVRYSCSA